MLLDNGNSGKTIRTNTDKNNEDNRFQLSEKSMGTYRLTVKTYQIDIKKYNKTKHMMVTGGL